MLCPICNKPLQEQKLANPDCTLYHCPANHGTLLSGGVLSDIKKVDDTEITHIDLTTPAPTRGAITCPHCGQSMLHVNFNDAEIFIDACPTSPFRWLDSGELRKVKEHEPDLSSVGAQELLRQIAVAPTLDEAALQKQVNPTIAIDPFAGAHNPRGLALMVVARALLHSKYTRLFFLVILLVTALIYLLVLGEFQ